MVKISVDIDALFRQLPKQEKVRLIRKWEKETWTLQLNNVVNRIRLRPAVRSISQKELTRIVEDVRRARYARSARRS